MAQIGRKLRSLEGGRVAFLCPGCGTMHQVRVEGAGRPRWSWNGSGDAPTFGPSVRVEDGHSRCHSFVREGRIQFLDDSTHALAGQTVNLPDLH